MYKSIFAAATLGMGLASATVAVPAEAQASGHIVTAEGPGGRSVTQSRSISRTPGSVSATRSLQTGNGRGYASTRTGTVSDGTYTSGHATTFDNGATAGRSSTVTGNGDGTADYSTTRTRPNGQTRTVTGTIGRAP